MWWRHFLKRDFWHFWLSCVKKYIFFNWDETGQDRYVFKGKFWASKFDLFDRSLTWLWVRCESESRHRIMRPKWPIKLVSCNTCYIFLRWPHLTWPWLWPVLTLACYLRGIFVISSVAFWQSLGLQLSLVWPRQPDKARTVSFDL